MMGGSTGRSRIRRAHPSEARSISELALRSKAHWAYNDAQLEVFREELSLSAADVVAHQAHVLLLDETLTGFYTLVPVGEGAVELQHLFVDPAQLRKGLGSELWRHALSTAREQCFSRMIIQSDPNAAGFYRALGATHESDIASSIPGRVIPLFSIALRAG